MNFGSAYFEMLQEQHKQLTYVHPLYCGAEFLPLRSNTRWFKEYRYLQSMATAYHWHSLPMVLLSELHDPGVAVLITNQRRKLCWVNEGFTTLTGYRKEEALGRSPSFLQGKDTRENDKQHFREKLAQKQHFIHSVLNYRKDGSTYECSIRIWPLHNSKQHLTHYLALERALH